MEFSNLTEFITRFKNEALSFNLSKEFPDAYQKLNSLRNLLEIADLTEEIVEVQNHAKKAFKAAKVRVDHQYQLKNYLAKHIGHTPSYLLYLRFYLEYFDLYEKASKKLIEIENKTTNKDYKSEIWFKLGILFANGTMNKYYNDNKTGIKEQYSAPKIAKELGDESYNKFILATMNDYPVKNSNGSKNIFNSLDKMQKIIKHCHKLQIEVTEDFTKHLPIE